MMCEECGVRPASIHLTTITQGMKTEKNLCPICMAKYHRLPGMDLNGIAGMLNNLILPREAEKNEDPLGREDAYPDIMCPECGTTYEEFRKSGFVGCAHCYSEFREPMLRILQKVHGSVHHTGKLPDAGKGGMSLKITLEGLKNRLSRAIEEEEYEQAAQIRDKIRSITRQMEGGEQ